MATKPPIEPMSPEPRGSAVKRAGIGAAVAAIIGAVVALEGGYVDHPNDPGGATKYGITERVARANGFTGDMRDLTKGQAASIYEREYIVRPGFMPLVEIDPAVAEEVVDTGVNMGPARPTRYFRRAVNEVCKTSLPIAAQIDTITVKAWADCRANLGPRACVRMLDSLDRQQRAEYDRLVRVNPRLKVFHRGWINHRIGNVSRMRCV
jgi:lysozyme family protein